MNETLPTDTIDALQAENALLREQADALAAAILDIDAHATGLDEDKDGFTTGGYIVSVGALHRALGVVGHAARKCKPGALCPPCEQAEALADALDKALFFAGERTSKLAQTRLSTCDTVLRAYREANHE